MIITYIKKEKSAGKMEKNMVLVGISNISYLKANINLSKMCISVSQLGREYHDSMVFNK